MVAWVLHVFLCSGLKVDLQGCSCGWGWCRTVRELQRSRSHSWQICRNRRPKGGFVESRQLTWILLGQMRESKNHSVCASILMDFVPTHFQAPNSFVTQSRSCVLPDWKSKYSQLSTYLDKHSILHQPEFRACWGRSPLSKLYCIAYCQFLKTNTHKQHMLPDQLIMLQPNSYFRALIWESGCILPNPSRNQGLIVPWEGPYRCKGLALTREC